MHLSEHQIRTIVDGEVDPQKMDTAQRHLAACPACRQKYLKLINSRELVSQHMQSLLPFQGTPIASVQAAQSRLRVMINAKEKDVMEKSWFSRYRPAVIAVGLMFVLGVALLFPSVRVFANGFLGMFRVHQLEVVEVNPGDLPEQLNSSIQLENFLSNDLHFEQWGEMQQVGDVAQANEITGYSIRLPVQELGELHLVVSPPARITFTVELTTIRAILEEIGRSDIALPAEFDGTTVSIDIPYQVTASFGECGREAGSLPEGEITDLSEAPVPNCTILSQMTSPEVHAPEELDLRQLGQAYLELLGMDSDEAARFSQNIDWASTLVIPIPVNSTSFQEVSVDGTTGTLVNIQDPPHQPKYMLIWIRDEIIYTLAGSGSASTAIAIAESLR
jgi:hypothetical protein